MQNTKLTLVVAVGIGLIAGICLTAAFSPSRAGAQTPVASKHPVQSSSATYEYKVIPNSVRPEGYEHDLNEAAGAGWHFAGTANNHLVMERVR